MNNSASIYWKPTTFPGLRRARDTEPASGGLAARSTAAGCQPRIAVSLPGVRWDLRRHWLQHCLITEQILKSAADRASTLLSCFVLCSFRHERIVSSPLRFPTTCPLQSRWLSLWPLLQPSVPLHCCLVSLLIREVVTGASFPKIPFLTS